MNSKIFMRTWWVRDICVCNYKYLFSFVTYLKKVYVVNVKYGSLLLGKETDVSNLGE